MPHIIDGTFSPRETITMPTIYPEQMIRDRFTRFQGAMEDIWKEHDFYSFYLPRIHKLIKDDAMPPFALNSFKNPGMQHVHTANNTFGYISHILNVARGRSGLMQSVATFEHYHSDLATIVYQHRPLKLLGVEAIESQDRQNKLLDIIIKSKDKEEMLDKIIEEKVRSIFYGNPLDFFLRDKAKLEFGSAFKDHYQNAMDRLAEIIARRNIYAHNNRKVDSKYLREVKNSPYKIGNIPVVDTAYLGEALNLMIGIASMSSCLVLDRIFKASIARGYASWAYKQFQKRYWQNT